MSPRQVRESLADLRNRAQAACSESSLKRLAESLQSDSRAGAQTLAQRCLRRSEDLRAERLRLSGLFALRRRLLRQGARLVAGVDEVGMGPLAGPVVAAAVILPEKVQLPGLDDSKRIPVERRSRLARTIHADAVAWAVGEVWPEEIDRLNIYQAGLRAMARAVEGLRQRPDHLLVDARRIPDTSIPQTPLIKGDARDGSIAAASVVAKVYRDALMQRLDADFPGYGFARHKGYATADHLAALRQRGPTPLHRRSFLPVSQARLAF